MAGFSINLLDTLQQFLLSLSIAAFHYPIYISSLLPNAPVSPPKLKGVVAEEEATTAVVDAAVAACCPKEKPPNPEVGAAVDAVRVPRPNPPPALTVATHKARMNVNYL